MHVTPDCHVRGHRLTTTTPSTPTPTPPTPQPLGTLVPAPHAHQRLSQAHAAPSRDQGAVSSWWVTLPAAPPPVAAAAAPSTAAPGMP